jgi:hypothetical protein
MPKRQSASKITGWLALCAALSLAGTMPIRVESLPQPAPPSSSVPDKELNAFEQKLLQRTFPIDPIDKRLQRLELLVFGATQYGSDLQRWRELQKAASSDAANAPKRADEAGVVSRIEKQVLKKTNPTMPIGARLSQVETKMFGQASPSMPTKQRIERLAKTLGMAEPFEGNETAIRPRFSTSPDGNFSFHVYGDPNQLRQMNPQVSEMMEEMDRQMRQFERFGNQMFDERDFKNLPNGGYNFHYEFQTPPSKQAPKKGPALKSPPPDFIPPYGDPNSI